METLTCESIAIRIYMCGDIDTARNVIRMFCLEGGICITLTPTEYIYTGGLETGFIVGINNYPRFPTTYEILLNKAEFLASILMEECYQQSYMIQTANDTKWVSRRDDIAKWIKQDERDKSKAEVAK